MKLSGTGAALSAVIALAAPGVASAAIPQGNLLLDADAEQTAGVSDDSSSTCPKPPWQCGGSAAKPTPVRYGSPGGFPSLAESQRIGGGNNFFAGGPGDDGTLFQNIDLVGADAEIDSSGLVATFSGCVGGRDTQADGARLSMQFWNQDYSTQSSSAAAPTPDRGGQTKLLPTSVTQTLPSGTRHIYPYVVFDRVDGSYNDGYADRLSLRFTAPGAAIPAANCTGSGDGGGGGGDDGGGKTLASVSELGFTATTFRAESRGPSAITGKKRKRRPKGTRVRYTLDQAAVVRFTVKRRAKGRRVKRGRKRRCVRPTRKNRRKKRCTRLLTRGSFQLNGAAGRNSFRFTGRIRGRKLPPARYVLVATPSVAGRKGASVSRRFRIVR